MSSLTLGRYLLGGESGRGGKGSPATAPACPPNSSSSGAPVEGPLERSRDDADGVGKGFDCVVGFGRGFEFVADCIVGGARVSVAVWDEPDWSVVKEDVRKLLSRVLGPRGPICGRLTTVLERGEPLSGLSESDMTETKLAQTNSAHDRC